MFDAKTCISKLFDYLSNLPTNAALKEHVAIIKERLYDIQNEVEKLKKENEKLLKENQKLKNEISKYENYIDLGVCALKRNPDGGLFHTPLCPSCHTPLASSFINRSEMRCPICEVRIPSNDIHAAIAKALKSSTE